MFCNMLFILLSNFFINISSFLGVEKTNDECLIDDLIQKSVISDSEPIRIWKSYKDFDIEVVLIWIESKKD